MANYFIGSVPFVFVFAITICPRPRSEFAIQNQFCLNQFPYTHINHEYPLLALVGFVVT
jgi:hypothetical protein